MDTGNSPSLSALRRSFPDGVATAAQLVAAGVPERTVYHRCLEGGPWQLILPGVILLFTGHPTRRQQVQAAVLLGGPDALVTGLEACRRHGIRRGPAGRPSIRDVVEEVHLLVPERRQVRAVGFVHVERTIRLPDAVRRNGIPLAPVVRACLDAARRLRAEGDVAELLSEAVQRGLCSVSALGHELEAGSRRGTAIPRRVLKGVADGVRSAAELAARELWRSTGLPQPWWNATVHTARGTFLGVVDCWLDDVAMAWEIESTEWHIRPADHDRTVDRAARLTAAGVVYTASKPRKIRLDRAGVIEMLRSTYAHACARPRPALQAMPTEGSAAHAGKPRSRKEIA